MPDKDRMRCQHFENSKNNFSIKSYPYLVKLLFPTIVAALLGTGCAGLPTISKVARINQPPAGKVLVNFHRPSNWGGAEKFAICDGDGKMLIDLPGGSEFQLVCDPGERIFIGWADQVSVVKADLAADKTYDVVVDISLGWVRGNIWLNPLAKGDARRDRLTEFEKREGKRVLGLNRTRYVEKYEAKNQERIQQIKRDFLGGDKSDRARLLQKDDCR
jgi:hypothetical protein